MRKPQYLSPTSLAMFYDHRNDFYIQYISDYKRPRPPQTGPMSVGSAFDAYVKSHLVERLIGKDPRFALEKILCDQVEPHNRDAARIAGKEVFDAYVSQGAMADILVDLEGCIGKPKFETTIEGFVTAKSVMKGEVPFLGKPDIHFLAPLGARVVHDWKVNGYYSSSDVSPSQGYVRIRTNDPRTNGNRYKNVPVTPHQGIKVSVEYPLDKVDRKWASQIAIYAWLLGEEIGGKFVAAIDQIACGRKPHGRTFRIAQHRSIITEAFQKELYVKALTAWNAIVSGHIFFEMTRKESDAQCMMLDDMASMPPDAAFDELCR